MRIPLLLLIAPAFAHAQDWALLNPAYKYNYSDDGSDTISNQVFVTHIDTLGPDSFRYELNRIGVVCDTCPASLGGPCDGCFVRVDQPQFMGFACARSGSDWRFFGPDTFMIKSPADVGSIWVFDATNGITAIVDAQWSDTVFDVSDSVRRILLSTGDTLLLSRSLGMLSTSLGSESHDLMGVEGAGVGWLFPDPLDYFDYQSGDELVYMITSIWWATPPGGPQFRWSIIHYWKAVVTGRTDVTDSILYSTSVARTFANPGYPGWLIAEPNWPMPLDHWLFSRTDVLSNHPILAAYPGQVVDTSICWADYYGLSPRYLVGHGITSDGRTIVRSQKLYQSPFGVPTSGFNGAQEVVPGVFPVIEEVPINLSYEQGLGLRQVQFDRGMNGALIVDLVGAIIDGDTIIQPPIIDWDVAVQEESEPWFGAFPNPAIDAITVTGAKAGALVMIHDLEGRLLRRTRLTSANEKIDVGGLNIGMYVLRLDGSRPRRFIIAR